MLLIRRRSKRKFFCDPLRRPCTCLAPWAFVHPSLRHWLLKARFHYSDFLETNSRRLELVGFQIPLQRLSRDKLSRACGGFVSSLSATSRASRRQTRDFSSLTQVCREFDSRKYSCNGIKNPTISRQVRDISTLSRGSRCSGIWP
jgi:hypothetical protein